MSRRESTAEPGGDATPASVPEACFGDLVSLDDPRAQTIVREAGLSREEAERHRKAVTRLSIRATK